MKHQKVTGQWITNIIHDFINDPSNNSLGGKFKEKAWDIPIVGFSSGGDPLYRRIKEDIGSFYLMPEEFFSKAFLKSRVTPEDLTVIAWVLPQTEIVKLDNRAQSVYVSERWARSRVFGEKINSSLRKHVVHELQKKGCEAVAPLLSRFFKERKSKKFGLASTWSERHAAYVSGLGTFGLSNGLITLRGVAMRCGSVIARIHIPPTKRQYKTHREYCLFYSKRECGMCMNRCPAGAISEKGHDKEKCLNYMENRMEEYTRINFGFKSDGCGLCQTGVPCESKIPK